MLILSWNKKKLNASLPTFIPYSYLVGDEKYSGELKISFLVKEAMTLSSEDHVVCNMYGDMLLFYLSIYSYDSEVILNDRR